MMKRIYQSAIRWTVRLIALLGIGLTPVSHANAALTINALTLNGASTVTVLPNATIAVSANTTSSTTLRSFGYRISTTAPGALTCVNTPNHSSGTFTDTFSITAPAAAGTYNAYFVAYDGNNCGGTASGIFTLTNGVVVFITNAANSTVVASPTSVAADGTTISTITVTLKNASNVAVPGMTVTLTAGSGSSTISAASGVSNASGVVTFTVKDAVAEAVTYTARDVTGGVTITQTATVTYSRLAALTVTKAFSPNIVATNAASTLSITLTNPNAFAIGGVAFSDTYPAALLNTVTPSLTNTCGGTATASAGLGSMVLTGGTIPASGSCMVTAQVASSVIGVYSNSTGTVTSNNALSAVAATAALTVGPSVSSFNAVQPGASAAAGKIFTKIAGQNFSLDIVALDATNALATSFTGTVSVEVVDNSSGGACAALPSIAALTNQTFAAGDAGRHPLSAPNTVANVYPNARLRISYPVAGPTVVTCSGDNFAIRPNAFANFSITDNDALTPGTARTLNNVAFAAGNLHKAGRPLTVQADAVNAAGTPAITTNYSGTPVPTLTACAGAACTGSFGAFVLGASFASGQLVSNAASYDNVGAFALQLIDSSFAAVDAADGSTAADRNIVSAAADVGRFVPDHFAVAVNTPTFATACSSGAFTYVGQSFGYANTASQPTITVTAQNLANSTTTLYTGNWWRITGASLTGKAYAALTGTLDTSGISGADPAIAETAGLPGTGTLTFNSGTGFFFTRAAPAVPFNAEIGLTINVTDADGIAYASNPVAFGAPTAGNGIAFSTGRQMRFGRLRLQNANGSQLIAMPIPMSAQYWNGSGFVTNTVDNCTAILIANIGLGSYLPNLGAGDTTATIGGVFNAGVGTLTLSAPGSAKHGSVDVTVNLTGAGKTYLQGAWAGATYTDNPTARATFGIYRNTNKFIFRQENY